MNRRPNPIPVTMVVSVTLAMLAQPAVWSAAAPAPLPARPNIVFILTDDLDTRSVAYIPLLRSLVIERGVTFTQFVVTYALCCPSRSTILTGQYVHNHRVLTDLLARKAIAFIRQAAAAGRPFFVHLSTYAPHAPATPAPRHEDAFSGVAAPRSPAFNEDDTSDKPAWVRSRAPLSPRQISDIDEHFRVRLQSLLAVDEMIAALVDVLAATGQLSRTYIFFTSDNGWHLGEHRIAAGKNTPYEESIRVPLVVRRPAVPEGRAVALLACSNGLAPTFAQIAGVPIPETVDGRSLVPLLGAAPPAPEAWRQAIAIEHYREQPDGLPQAAPERSPGGRGIPEFHGVRGRDLVYVEYATGERELYDLTRDPYQLESVPTTETGILGSLSARLAALKRCSGASCRLAEDAPLPTLTGR